MCDDLLESDDGAQGIRRAEFVSKAADLSGDPCLVCRAVALEGMAARRAGYMDLARRLNDHAKSLADCPACLAIVYERRAALYSFELDNESALITAQQSAQLAQSDTQRCRAEIQQAAFMILLRRPKDAVKHVLHGLALISEDTPEVYVGAALVNAKRCLFDVPNSVDLTAALQRLKRLPRSRITSQRMRLWSKWLEGCIQYKTGKRRQGLRNLNRARSRFKKESLPEFAMVSADLLEFYSETEQGRAHLWTIVEDLEDCDWLSPKLKRNFRHLADTIEAGRTPYGWLERIRSFSDPVKA